MRKEEERENEPTCGKPWRCEQCGSTIAITRNGECVVQGVVRLGEDYTLVECPVCGRENGWYFVDLGNSYDKQPIRYGKHLIG